MFSWIHFSLKLQIAPIMLQENSAPLSDSKQRYPTLRVKYLEKGPRRKLLGTLDGLAACELEFSSIEEIQGKTSSAERGEW
ncbi:hypothetical protein H5410_024439 [Solanum commersonii]|uniref:Uncharacterized protein n=1 Tax=Solanum commersonii TaxID=4109 RepID=A0A9J5ZM13_SOLCO|nr:hypothetical protein H5410_024439 [Solanum commersonii]